MFRAPFSNPFANPFPSATAAAAVSWWLSGGISAANAIAVYQPKGAADIAASYVNLANPGTYNAAPGVAPTIDADGWVFDGTTQYLTTGIVPQVTWSVLVRFSGFDAGNENTIYGVFIDTARSHLIQLNNANVVFYSGNTATAAGLFSAGVLGIAGKSAYKNGSNVGTIGTGGGTITNQAYIGALNFSGSAIQIFFGKIQALAIYNATLTAPQVLAVSTAMAAL